ncbi:MAG: metallopeptidase TldD-related protein, partial [Candidatus Thorarchaeota archaeon]
VARIAAEKATNGFGMKYIDPGEYEVILEPAAVAGLMMMIGFIGFSARAHHDYISFLRDRIGEKIFSEKLTVWDNPLDTRLVGASLFDEEGVPHQNLELVTDGVVKNITYDTMTAAKDGVESTGNQARLWGPPSPRPIHMIAKEGSSSVEEMIAETKRGVLVTHFHYQNPIKPTEGVFTGLTRDGTWYVEDGEIKYPLKTLRYTDAAPRFFKEIDLVGMHPDLNRPTPFGFMPPMKLPSFRFSGSSKE